MALVRCVARFRNTSKTRSRKRSFKVPCPRPSELEVYLGDTGIYCRPVEAPAELQEQPVGAPSEDKPPVAGTPLFMF